ncbi:hypothetical protein [Pseudomonas huanghezhanensis]|uniref:hypothetical protein n=1 Tax=Pseudomonas huanghezhanensis TaxID=3002903 RepID=UPI002286B93E|nr:hypothetical protein [Pseudomonas sp. BSw22131]
MAVSLTVTGIRVTLWAQPPRTPCSTSLKEGLTGQAARHGAYLQQRMQASFADLPIVGEVRGVGMMAAIEFVADPTTQRRFDPHWCQDVN